jgi:hypothetical protein
VVKYLNFGFFCAILICGYNDSETTRVQGRLPDVMVSECP